MRGLTVWNNMSFDGPAAALLNEALAGHHLVPAAESHPCGPTRSTSDPALGTADVAFGQPDPAQVMALPRLRWVHLSSAGYTPYDREDLRQALHRRGAVLTKSSLVYDQPCAEHALALILAHCRQLSGAHRAQGGDRAWLQVSLRAQSRLLAGQEVLLIGFGSIARRLVELLIPLRMNVVGVRRRVAGDEPVRVIAESDPRLVAALGAADHVVTLLPGSERTRGFFDAARFAAMKPGAAFYNVGRGTTVDQDALQAALAAGPLAAAYLDVTDPEPLPPAHPLWTTPNCTITPHTAGGHSDEPERIVRHFVDNFRRFVDGRPLLDQVWAA